MALRSLNSVAPDRRKMKKPSPFLPPPSSPSLLPCPNDENLHLLPPSFSSGKPPLESPLPPPLPVASAAAAAAASAPPVASSTPDLPSPEIEYILSQNLCPLENADACLTTLLERLDSKDWLKTCEAINNMRQLTIFHTASLLPHLDNAVQLLVKAMKNPRSALCKTAIMASADLFKAYQDAMLTILEPLLLQLLLKASQDKRFVCEEAERSLVEMTAWLSPAPLMVQLRPYVTHRSPRVRAKAASCVCRSVSRLGPEGIKDYGFRPLIQIAASQLNDQLPEARESARKLVADLYAAYPHRISGDEPSDTVSEQPDANQSEEHDWQQFCSTQLSSHVAQAVLRLTSSS